MSKFNDAMGAVPIKYTPPPKTVKQIAAIGAAFPDGEHMLTPEQQIAWFGGVVFSSPVAWGDGAFVSKGTRLTPEQVARRVAGGQ